MNLTEHLIARENCRDIRQFFQSKGLQYLESNVATGNVMSTMSAIRTRVSKQSTWSESALVTATRSKLIIAFLCPEIGYGCFAGQQIDAGQIIGEYTGLLLSDNTGRHDSRYAIDLIPEEVRDRLGQSLYLSAAKGGSELRFVNHIDPQVKISHPDGRTETGPNAEVRRVWSGSELHIVYVAKRLVKKGDEIRIQYHWSEKQFPGGKASQHIWRLK